MTQSFQHMFRVLHIDLSTGISRFHTFPGRDDVLGGSGLAALLFAEFGSAERPARHPSQPIIFAIGPLTGRFPMMSKVVCGFKSPYHEQYTESHAGGRLGMSLARCGLDALVFTGAAAECSIARIDASGAQCTVAPEFRGKDLFATERMLHARLGADAGRASLCTLGPAAENGSTFGCVTVDTYRHFGRLGAGTALAAKRLKAFAVVGQKSIELPKTQAYKSTYRELAKTVANSSKTAKYRGPGTAGIVESINALGALPWRNLEESADTGAERITGAALLESVFAEKRACSGCTAGCIHLAHVKRPFGASPADPRLISYDYEHIFALGSMLGVTDPHDVMGLILSVERQGLDIMSAGVVLAWATEAMEKGIVTEAETGLPLAFGRADLYAQAIDRLGAGETPFYQALGRGAAYAAKQYGGEDFTCVLGQEMAGYATGEVFFAAQSLNFRHSHLDNLCYCYDYEFFERDPNVAVSVLLQDERMRTLVNCMVGCMFGRKIYTSDVFAQCLDLVGFGGIADGLEEKAAEVQKLRWRTRFETGYQPHRIKIPKRFTEVVTARGPIDPEYMEAVRLAYADAILEMCGARELRSGQARGLRLTMPASG